MCVGIQGPAGWRRRPLFSDTENLKAFPFWSTPAMARQHGRVHALPWWVLEIKYFVKKVYSLLALQAHVSIIKMKGIGWTVEQCSDLCHSWVAGPRPHSWGIVLFYLAGGNRSSFPDSPCRKEEREKKPYTAERYPSIHHLLSYPHPLAGSHG